MQMIEDDGASATARLRKTACLIAAREKQMARLQEEFRKLLIQSAEIAVDGHDLPDIVETIDEPLEKMQFVDRTGNVWYKWAALAAAVAVLALIFVPFPLFVSALGKVLPSRSIAIDAPSRGAESLILLAFDESQAIGVKPGMPATVRFESLPDRAFRGTVESVGGLSANEIQDASQAAQPQDTGHVAPFNLGVVYVGIRLDERPPENVYGTDANTQICYGRFQLGKWIMRTLAG